jgi:hypothetical protein
MCFVAIHRQGNTRYLLSNRDEYLQRPAALPPEVNALPGCVLLYPKDAKAGGTWVAVRNDGVAAILLNGADKPHISKPPYRQSRGLIIPQLLQHKHPENNVGAISFEDVEPFTLCLSKPDALFLYQWNGHGLTVSLPEEKENPCWSSATLYDPGMVMQRSQFWQQWIQSQSFPDVADFLSFAKSKAPGNQDTQLFMNRGGGLQTISTTLIRIGPYKAEMHYHNYPLGQSHFQSLSLDLPETG